MLQHDCQYPWSTPNKIWSWLSLSALTHLKSFEGCLGNTNVLPVCLTAVPCEMFGYTLRHIQLQSSQQHIYCAATFVRTSFCRGYRNRGLQNYLDHAVYIINKWQGLAHPDVYFFCLLAHGAASQATSYTENTDYRGRGRTRRVPNCAFCVSIFFMCT